MFCWHYGLPPIAYICFTLLTRPLKWCQTVSKLPNEETGFQLHQQTSIEAPDRLITHWKISYSSRISRNLRHRIVKYLPSQCEEREMRSRLTSGDAIKMKNCGECFCYYLSLSVLCIHVASPPLTSSRTVTLSDHTLNCHDKHLTIGRKVTPWNFSVATWGSTIYCYNISQESRACLLYTSDAADE